mmetsp:Transcript_78566/g.197424  ORF Transcript_78566/g.197424 Transcript_78566/m.197424 type:complete len:94 (-) Transcript_78566:212-493(-)
MMQTSRTCGLGENHMGSQSLLVQKFRQPSGVRLAGDIGNSRCLRPSPHLRRSSLVQGEAGMMRLGPFLSHALSSSCVERSLQEMLTTCILYRR